MGKFIKENAKAVTTFFTVLGTWGGTALADNGVNGVELFGLCGVVVATVGAYAATNAPTEQQLIELNDAINH